MSATRNFEFRVAPKGGQRGGRYVLGGSTALPNGVPVLATDDAEDGLGRNLVTLAGGAQVAPKPGEGGILVYEEIRYVGVDPFLTTYSDMDTVAVGSPVQLVSGSTVKIALTNTVTSDFLLREDYPTGRKMVAGGSATPTVRAGDYLTPQTTPNDVNGYWVSSNAANAWLYVTHVNTSTGVIEARLTF